MIFGDTCITFVVDLTGGDLRGALPVMLATTSAGAFSVSVVHAAGVLETFGAFGGAFGSCDCNSISCVVIGGGDLSGICDGILATCELEACCDCCGGSMLRLPNNDADDWLDEAMFTDSKLPVLTIALDVDGPVLADC